MLIRVLARDDTFGDDGSFSFFLLLSFSWLSPA